MTDVVDALLVTLGLDASQFRNEQNLAILDFKKTQVQAGQTAKAMEAEGKRAAQFFSNIKTEALSLMGVLLGGKGLTEFVGSATRDMAALGREAKNIGVAVPMLDAFRMAVERNGGSADAAVASMRGLTDEMEKFKVTGQSGIIRFLNPIGATRGDDAIEVFKKFSAYAQAHKDDVPLINFIGKGLGLDQGSINEAMRGIDQVNKDLAESGKLGVTTPAMSDAAADLQRKWEALRQAADHLGNTILTSAEPAMGGMLDMMKEMIVKNPEATTHVGEFIAVLAGLQTFKLGAGFLSLAGMEGTFTSLIGVATTFASRLLLVAAAAGLWYEALHPTAANAGELEELNKEDAANGESHDHSDLDPNAIHAPTRDPFKAWMRKTVSDMPEGPARRWMQAKFGSEDLATGGMTPEQTAFLQTLSDPESGGAYNIRNGGDTFEGNDFPMGPNAHGGAAAGRYQFMPATWKDQARKLGLSDFSPANQDKAAWDYASTIYRAKTGRDLQADLASGGHGADITGALHGVWPSLAGGSQQLRTQSDFDHSMQDRMARLNSAHARATAIPGGPMFPNPVLSPYDMRTSFDPSLTMAPRDRIPGAGAAAHSSSTDVSIGTLVVHTAATDSKGIVHSIGNEISDNLRITADRGLN